MAKRGLIVQVFKNIIDTLKPRPSNVRQVGEDLFGNRYFVRARNDRYLNREERYFEPATKMDFEAEKPPEWDSWLRRSRKDPPSPEEIAASVALMKQKKENTAELESKLSSAPKAIAEKDPTEFPSYGKEYESKPGESAPGAKQW